MGNYYKNIWDSCTSFYEWTYFNLADVAAIWNYFRAEGFISHIAELTQISQQLYTWVISHVISRNCFMDILQAPWFLVLVFMLDFLGFFQWKRSRQFIFDRLFINYTLLLFAGWNFFPHRFHFIIRLFNSALIKMSS